MQGKVLAAAAVSPEGKWTDVTNQIADGRVGFRVEGPNWKLVLLTARPTGQSVKRAAPGGAGPMINPFSPAVMADYLKPFTAAFDVPGAAKPRAMYHDSFEYSGNWTHEVLDEFPARRGYRLQDQLGAFAGAADAETAARVKSDYRETLSDLMIEEVFPQWFAWCRARGIRTRNQAHGSPANLLDLYAQADIPETEMFGRGNRNPLQSSFAPERFQEGDRNVLVCKFASSAAHLAGHPLTASETCTWMAEHFCETLEEAKCFADLMFVAGVNHVFYHGTAYSPDDVAWPGWLFYAATQMNPRNAIWHDAPVLNAYIARCQSVLQTGLPDNDVLLYWPIHDLWHNPAGMSINCSIHGADWFSRQPVGTTAAALWRRGFGFDYVSDRWLAKARVEHGQVVVGGNRYRAIVLPPVTHIPLATMKHLAAMAQAGAVVICERHLPQDVPGLASLAQRRAELRDLLAGIGTLVQAGDVEALLGKAGIRREMLADHAGAMLIRRRTETGRTYLVANQSAKPIDGWLALATPAASVAILDPMAGRTGSAAVRSVGGMVEVSLYIEPGHSIILQTFLKDTIAAPAFVFTRPGRTALAIQGPWQVKFVSGGPTLPKEYQIASLDTWTANGDPETEAFAGTAVYTTTFDAPADAGPHALDMGRVCHSARVCLDGEHLGTLIMPPYRIVLPRLRAGNHRLEVEVTNLSANRIRDMDRRKIPWRAFHDINFVNIRYQPFDASRWPILESGLLGPVTVRVCDVGN